jgi:cell division protein FtsZ
MIFEFDETERRAQFARIRVVGVGGGGGNAVNRMIQERLDGVEFVSVNTDAQALQTSESHRKIQIGKELTRGLGAGARPEVGRQAVIEDRDEVAAALEGSDMVFITAGMGGGTGTGAAPVVAEIARELGALTVAIVSKPFHFEGRRRMQQADEGLQDLKQRVDTLIVVPNQRLLAVVGQGTSLGDAFRVADSVLLHATQGISDLITVTGLVNVDFADVKTIMTEMGDAIMGTGYGTGAHRAIEAAQEAISSPLLDEVSIAGARGVLLNITGGRDLSLHEVSEVSSVIHEAAGEDANIIFGAVVDSALEDELRVTVIATGIRSADEPVRETRPGGASERVDKARVLELPRRREEEYVGPAVRGRGPAAHPLFQSDVLDESARVDLDIPTFIRRQMD